MKSPGVVHLPVMLLFVLLALSVTCTGGLEMLALRVPAQADVRDDVTMTCEYSLGGKSLYSVKWYKDEHEFFRYMPNHTPASQSFKFPGITLLMNQNPKNSVILTQLSFNTSGNYRCEVSTEGPIFKTVAANMNMSVLALPKEDPTIEGILSSYSVGDYVTGNCTSAPSYPGSKLAWHINGQPVESYLLQYYSPMEENLERYQLITNRLGIRFQASRDYFTSSSTPGVVQIECMAHMGGHIWRRQVSPSLAKLTNQRLAQPQNAAPSKESGPIWLLFCLTLLTLHSSEIQSISITT